MYEGNGLLYMRARYYDPEIGRFISKDPIGFAGGDLNLYAYVQNNPVSRIDPLGLWYIDINVSLGIILGGTGGVMIGPNGIYPYLGGGVVIPSGISFTFSPCDPTPGWNEGLQIGLPWFVGGQGGYSYKTNRYFWEAGIVTPGGSFTDYYVWGPYKVNYRWEVPDIPQEVPNIPLELTQ
jgi:RHS repeat-associated protein